MKKFSPTSRRALAVVAIVGVTAPLGASAALAAPEPLPAGSTVTAEKYNELVEAVEELEAIVEQHHPGSFPPDEEPEPTTTQVVATATAGNGQATLTWDTTLVGVDPATVDGVYVYRDGTDSMGTGSWGTLEPAIDGNRVFLNLVNGTSYTLGAEVIVDGVPIATDEVTVTPSGTVTNPPPDPDPDPSEVEPTGVSGDWDIVFQDEFNGTSIDTSKWYVHDVKNMNDVRAEADNVTVVNGEARLQRSAAGVGAMITSDTVDGVGKVDGFELQEGQVVEARVYFPGNGTDIYNWSAWWTTSDPWANGGEHDIAEQLDGGDLTINYHYGAYPNVTHANQRPNPAGYWGDAYHTYALHRKADSADVYWDGQLVKSYPTYDNGDGETLILNAGGGTPQMLGLPGALRVDYVRAWEPAS